MSEKTERPLFHQEFADKVIAMLEAGTAPWQVPWTPAQNLAPRNPVSGTVYKGVNRLHLSMQGYGDPRWMTLKQANAQGYRVKAGSRSTRVVYYQFTEERDKLDENGQPSLGEDGKPQRETVSLDRPIMRIASVFNATQIENYPQLEKQDVAFDWEPQEKAEHILANSGAVIEHDQHDRAFYRPMTDEIHLPPKSAFDAPDKYYATALHELGHWTGHASRMNREFGPFGSQTYAKEELRAEIASWMTGQDIGVGHEPGQHAAYVKSWVQALRDDPLEIMRACRDAEQIKEYVMGLEHSKDLHQEQAKTHEESQEAAVGAPEKQAASILNKELAKQAQLLMAQLSSEKDEFVRFMIEEQLDDIREKAGFTIEDRQRHRVEKVAQLAASSLNKELAKQAQLLMAQSSSEKDEFVRFMIEEQLDNIREKAGFTIEDRQRHRVEKVAQLAALEDAPARAKAAGFALTNTYLHVAYKDKEAAKALGACWDKDRRSWYAPAGTELAPLQSYLTAPERSLAAPALPPQEEFARKLADLGLDLQGRLPEMDGQIHRVPLAVKNGKGLDGAYCLHADGVPAGWAQNHVTGEKTKLIATGLTLSDEDKALQRQERAQRLQEAEQARKDVHNEVARQCREFLAGLPPASPDAAYLQAKGVDAFGLLQDQEGNVLIPLRDVEGDLRGFQAIHPDGEKRFVAGMEKRGNFHTIADGQDFSQGEILLCEGYATGASLHMATGKPVAVAFDSGNLEPVARALRQKYPEAAITICADNDHALQRDGKPYNVGIEKARKAALAVDGKVKTPMFTAKEQAKGLTDFNDLHKERGLDAVRQHLGMAQEKGKELGR